MGQLLHGVLSVAVVALALAHMLLVGYYLDAAALDIPADRVHTERFTFV
ncbi:hypothetical protein [Nocardia sp. NPDC002869]